VHVGIVPRRNSVVQISGISEVYKNTIFYCEFVVISLFLFLSRIMETVTDPEYGVQSAPSRLGKYRREFNSAFADVFINPERFPRFDEDLGNLVKPGKSRYEWAVSALKVIDSIIPKSIRGNIKSEYGFATDNIPFDSNDYQIGKRLGSGGENSVFLLSSQKNNLPSYVLKINHLSHFENNPGKLLKAGMVQKKEYEEIKDNFAEIDGLIPQENYLILHGNKNKKPALAMIQPFMGDNLRDLFNDFEKDELLNVIEKNPSFKKQLTSFVKVLLSNNDLVDREIDILGNNNVVVVNNNGEEKLIMLDPHFRSVYVRGINTREQIRRRVLYLNELIENT
jgi:hypothetical protein